MTIFMFVIMLGVITVVLAIRLTAREDRGYRLLGYQHRLSHRKGFLPMEPSYKDFTEFESWAMVAATP